MDGSRLRLTDATRGRIAAALAAVQSRAGAPPRPTDRDFVEAVLYRARTGSPWRDRPQRFGTRGAVDQRSRRRERAGSWRALFATRPADRAGVEAIPLDSSAL